jgi:hypothetical protein
MSKGDERSDLDVVRAFIRGAVSEGVQRAALLRQVDEIERVQAGLIAEPGGVPTPDQLESVRQMLRSHRNMVAVLQENTEIEINPDVTPGAHLCVNVRLRCPKTHQLLGPLLKVRLKDLETIGRWDLRIARCKHCGESHTLADANAVIVPYTDEQIERSRTDP